jgi:hypothetical protein
MQLKWPYEGAAPPTDDMPLFAQPGSNICLDFHGDPGAAQLVVFSDGNHYMALAEALALFRSRHPKVNDIFYATTPPRVIVQMLKSGSLLLGNLELSVAPHVFISPASVLERLREDGYVREHTPFVTSRGSVMLVRKGNPKHIAGILDLMREDVRIFLSNPAAETFSYEAYATTLRHIAVRDGLNCGFSMRRREHYRAWCTEIAYIIAKRHNALPTIAPTWRSSRIIWPCAIPGPFPMFSGSYHCRNLPRTTWIRRAVPYTSELLATAANGDPRWSDLCWEKTLPRCIDATA